MSEHRRGFSCGSRSYRVAKAGRGVMRKAHGHEFSYDDGVRADGVSRRSLLKGASLAAIGAAIGAAIPFGRFMPQGYVPVALAQDAKLDFPGKSAELVVIGDKPLVAETPAHLLDDDVTPTEVHYIRNNGQIPELPADPDAWQITIDGEVDAPLDADPRRAQAALRERHPSAGPRVRRQRPQPVRPGGARQPLDHGRRRLRALDRGAAQGRARGGGAEAGRDLHRPLRRRPAPLGRSRESRRCRAASGSRRRWSRTRWSLSR